MLIFFLRYRDIFYNFEFDIDIENIENCHVIDIESNC